MSEVESVELSKVPKLAEALYAKTVGDKIIYNSCLDRISEQSGGSSILVGMNILPLMEEHDVMVPEGERLLVGCVFEEVRHGS